METALKPHDSIDGAYVFLDSKYRNYMIAPVAYLSDVHIALAIRPPYVNLVRPIHICQLKGKPAQLVLRYDALKTLPRCHFRRFMSTAVVAIQYMAAHKLYHGKMWNRHSFWVHNDNYYIPWFSPNFEGSAHRMLKDSFILACNMVFDIGGITFSDLANYLATRPDGKYLMSLYKSIDRFSDDNYQPIFDELDMLKNTIKLNLDHMSTLANNKAERLVQQCILHSVNLIDDN